MGRFYRAQLAARQFESEWAIFGVEAWQQVWDGLLDDWAALSPDEQDRGEHEAGLSLTSLMDTSDGSLWFGRVFRSGRWRLWASISAIPGRGLALKVACASDGRTLKFLNVAHAPDDAENWTSASTSMLSQIDPAALREVARSAVTTAGRRGRNAPDPEQ